MKSIILFITSMLIVGYLNAQDSDQIQFIRQHFNYVNDNLNSFKTEKSETFDESTDGADISKYYDGKECVKVRTEYYGETGKLFREYYVKDNELLFVFDQKHNYNMPYYMDSTRAAQSEFDQWFDPKKTKLEESRFYFKDNKMIRWIDPAGKYVSDDADNWGEKEQFYVKDLKSRLK